MKNRIEKDVAQIVEGELAGYELELDALERIKRHDEYTYLHSLNVARLSVMLGKRLQLDDDMLKELGWAGLLHDLGKLHVPIEILNKEAKFAPEELAIMRSHPLEAISAFVHSQDIDLFSLERLCAAFEHHQRFDLKGYPSVQYKLSLHPFSRIVAVADTFDAMTTDRIYQKRMLPDVALKIMSQGYGSIFDPVVLQAFITGMGAYPVGTLVKLSNDQLGLVVRYEDSSAFDRPKIRLIDTNEIIDLMAEQHKEIKVLNSEFPEDHGIETIEEYLWT